MTIKAVNLYQQNWLSSDVSEGGYYIPCHEDDTTGEFVSFAKLDKNKSYQLMRSKGTVHFFVIDGEMIIGSEKYGKGTYVRIAGSKPFTPSTEKGCEILCIYPEGWELVE